ncbi:acetate--CoA ligase family protein [Streptomyces lydicus]
MTRTASRTQEVCALLAGGSTVLLDLHGEQQVRAAYRDLTVRLGAADIRELLTALRCAAWIYGHRGTGPADVAALEDVPARLSRTADGLPELAEAECNPVIARPDGATAVDVRVRLLPRRAPDPYLRRLP